jgi:hypothetical protein
LETQKLCGPLNNQHLNVYLFALEKSHDFQMFADNLYKYSMQKPATHFLGGKYF